MYRHLYTYPNVLIFTNLAPEHIESHGSFEKYLAAKLSLRDAVVESTKKLKCIVTNKDDEHGELFLDAPEIPGVTYSLKQAEPYVATERGVLLTFEGVSIHSPLLGKFNIYNILAAATFARTQDIPVAAIKRALEKVTTVAGRAEKIEEGQNFSVIVDYAHTPESLEALYSAFPDKRKICVLGNTGGGRDTWKRPNMAAIADTHCSVSILTDEDPYDEDPIAIIDAMKKGFSEHIPEIILNRREAIRKALSLAHPNDVVLITGKGTDPFIMGPNGTKTPWSDAKVTREELGILLEPNNT
jgi:UDP-N-acetylmuramoyl-L-alanyl-D-glutamate--2,6-diaminopimelate ligase